MNIMETIKTRGLLFDGAMGSMLIARGLEGGESPESWNLSHPDRIREIHQTYFEAGADVASANTFGGTAMKLAKMGVKGTMEEINRAGIRLAREACGAGQFVAGDFGDLGEMLAPMGPVTFDDAVACFSDQASVMADEGVDLFIIETVFDINQALAAIRAIRSVSDTPIACSLTFKETPRGFFTIFGNAPGDSMKTLSDEGCSVVGANCAMGSDTMIRLAEEIKASVEIPVIIQPNAGLPETGPGQSVSYPEDEDFFADNIMKLKALGIEIVGGCCGTTPDYIRTIKNRLSSEE